MEGVSGQLGQKPASGLESSSGWPGDGSLLSPRANWPTVRVNFSPWSLHCLGLIRLLHPVPDQLGPCHHGRTSDSSIWMCVRPGSEITVLCFLCTVKSTFMGDAVLNPGLLLRRRHT
ncbi:hypothetical protein DPEC_G00161420 [Dallia pectoralis]|uniref:Uncharacterized protein n=1 Tax=Dallia pectoralis TaxID=75939 RepID=A0ACC2GGL4_DALPE|nr:hypothetical protein DPEC_G00161420 [Dallia pectoralis]